MSLKAKNVLISLAISFSFSVSAFSHLYEVGMQKDKFMPAHRNEAVNYLTWYPAQKDGDIKSYGDTPIMYGRKARKGATPYEGKHPVVIFSHGGGGNAAQLGWLAEPLVNAGYVVVAPNHPGSTTGNASAQGILALWERSKDVSRLLDRLKKDKKANYFMDFDRVHLLGFSAGGYTALNLAGVRPNKEKLRSYCEIKTDSEMRTNFCQYIIRTGGDDLFAKMDWQQSDRDYRDARVKKVIAVDPGIVDALELETINTLGKNAPPTLLINLGLGDAQSIVNAEPIHALMPKSVYRQVADANHFSFLAQCRPNAKAILADEGELEPLCDAPKGATRTKKAVQAEVVKLVLNFLAE